MSETQQSRTRPARKAAIDVSAFEPDSRARAILRGLDFAQADLKAAGGAFDIEQVRRLLHGVSRQAVDKRVNDGGLLAVPGPNNRGRFPAAQFTDDGQVVEGLKAVRDALGYTSPWALLNFLVNPHDGLGGDKPTDRLRIGDVESVVTSAARVGVQGA